ncbi:MAG: hypothetical protein AB1422_06995 [bacterium]
MNSFRLKIMSFLGVFILNFSILSAQPTEEGLLKAWEELQKNDPKTVVFEKIKERCYKFKTEWFPFDGELKVLNIIVDDTYAHFEGGYYRGTIEVELVGLPDDILKKYSYSHSMWCSKNSLCFDNKIGKWLTYGDHGAELAKRAQKYPSFLFRVQEIFYYVWIIVLGAFLVYTIIKFNRVIKISEESYKVLKEISEKLKDKTEK